jgi:hypothetical protein
MSTSYNQLPERTPTAKPSKLLIGLSTLAVVCLIGSIAYLQQGSSSSLRILSSSSLASIDSSSEEIALYSEMFRYWKLHHKKEYDSASHEMKKLQTFIENHKKIVEWNSQADQTSTVALN